MSFKNKVAIVTGAGQGIGYQVCYDLAAEGCYVLLNDVDETLAKAAAKELVKLQQEIVFQFMVMPATLHLLNILLKLRLRFTANLI